MTVPPVRLALVALAALGAGAVLARRRSRAGVQEYPTPPLVQRPAPGPGVVDLTAVERDGGRPHPV